MGPTRILKIGLLITVLLFLWLVDPIDGLWSKRITPSNLFVWVGFLCFCVSVLLIIISDLVGPNLNGLHLSGWLPAQNTTLLIIPIYFFGISAFSRNWLPADIAPDGWLSSKNSRMTIHANLTIIEEIRPGLVIANTEWLSTEHYTGRLVRLPGQKKKVRTANYIQSVNYPPFRIAVQTKTKDTPTVGCEFTVKLTPKYFAKSLNENQYLQSLRKYGASSYLWLSPWLIQSSKCKPDLRSTLVRGMIHQITVAKKLPFSDDEIRFSDESEGIALGMLTGRAGWMNRDTKSLARGLGILHVFAASGLHLGIFYGVLYWPLSRLFGPKHGLATVPPLIVAFGYVWLLNFPVSLVRAFFFLSLFALRSFVHRRITTTDHILNTALLTALFFPESMISLSALLSFSAVGGILYLLSPIEKVFNENHKLKESSRFRPVRSLLKRTINFIRMQGQIGFVASLPVTPSLIYFFKAYGFLSPIANILLVPLAGVLLPLLVLSILTHLSFPNLFFDQFLWFIVIHGFELMLSIMKIIQIPEYFVKFENPIPILLISISILLVTVLVIWLYYKTLLRRKLTIILLLSLFALTGPAGYLVFWFFIES
ncbi:MAG: ComEC/Rec2 family competence protein [Leptonema sp. (in: Bacteria)]|nr:ComEC/Rec2 family competence protein [Leptonema sp. (in: bacteria)]